MQFNIEEKLASEGEKRAWGQKYISAYAACNSNKVRLGIYIKNEATEYLTFDFRKAKRMWVFGVHQPEKYLISDFWKEGERGEGKRFEEEKKLVIQVRIYLHWPWPNSFHRDDTRAIRPA